MRRLFRSALALLTLGSSLIGCSRSGEPSVPATANPTGDRSSPRTNGTQPQVTVYVPGIT